jgi:hypothetical protein
VTLKENVLAWIKATGPKSNAELVAKFKVAAPSLRRSCGELAKEGKLVPVPSGGDKRVWGLSSDARAEGVTDIPAISRPKPTPAEKKAEPPVDVKDWRMTDFCF